MLLFGHDDGACGLEAAVICRFKVRTLEEAELEMNGGQQARQLANSRLAALVANGGQPSTCTHSLAKAPDSKVCAHGCIEECGSQEKCIC